MLSLLACAALAVASDHAPAAPAAAAAVNERLLTNEGLVVLARAGYNERFLTELVQAQPGRFDTSVEGLVYLAKQGISEKLVRLIIARQRATEQRDAERAAQEAEEPMLPITPASTPGGRPGPHIPPRNPHPPKPVKMKVVNRKLLVPASPGQNLGPNPAIIVERRLLGDRYYALPGAQAPVLTPIDTPRAQPQRPVGMAAPLPGTQVAAFH
ncbi:MAG: hypothetical protein IT162_00065 [Bryobacterales bacterium]|nr:hypothetical protein [Bryobacterales bacterium]